MLSLFLHQIRDGPFIIQGGAGIFLKKIVCFPTGEKKIMSSTKLKIKSLFFIQSLFSKPFKGLQITQNLTCIKHVDLLLAAVY